MEAQTTEAPQQQQQLQLSPEDMLAKAAGLSTEPDRPRNEQGRFVAKQEAPAAEAKPETTPEEQKPEEAKPEAKTEDAPEDEIKWDAIKDLKVKVPMKNGDKEWVDEVTFEDLRNQRMMHADYMAKRREFDEQAKSHESKIRDTVERERNQYLGALNVLHQSVMQVADQELANVDWAKLAQEDPAKYVQLQARAQLLNSTLQRVASEQEKVQKQQADERQKHIDQAVSESRTKLKEAIPAWNEDLYQSLLRRGVDTYGFKPDEVGQWWDHRVMRVLHDAHQWQLHKEQKPTAEKKVIDVPPVLKSGPQKAKVNPQIQQFQEAKKRLASNGKDIDAAAAVMSAFVNQGRTS